MNTQRAATPSPRRSPRPSSGPVTTVRPETADEDLRELRATLPAGHPIDTLYQEHDEILHFLDLLEQVAPRIQAMAAYDPESRDLAFLKHLAEHLVAAEKHHAREEDVLFPALEERGVRGPTRVMRAEHNQFRPKKHRLLVLAESVGPVGGGGFGAFKKEVGEIITFIAGNLREHIYKENTVLYPAALRLITDPATWEEIREKCDAIGYCCFTPGKGHGH